MLSLAVPFVGTAAAGAEPLTSPDVEPTNAPHIWLKGPFGTVLGGEPAAPAGSLPADEPLDLWMRQAPLLLGTDMPFDDLAEVSVVSEPRDGQGPVEQLSVEATEFAGPETTGVSVITATVRTEASGTSKHAWLVHVPDREGDPDALFDIPGPRVQLVSKTGAVDGERGHGCYVYMCMEAGYRPPVETLEVLPVTVGEIPSLRIDDDSAMVSWKGTLESLDKPGSERIFAEEAFEDAPRATPRLTGLEPTTAGEWLLELLVEYDRDRGWQWFLYRLSAE
ncbi:MAG: hypothetical protein U9O18_08555 [Chloroflexota bacterium]|nr:hypothetical protein [Chloroflexota bacterium]